MSDARPLPIPLLPKPSVPGFEYRMHNIDPQICASSVVTESPLKRVQVQAACVACHKKKTEVCKPVLREIHGLFVLTRQQCDGNRPSCARCTKNGALCRYDVEPNTSRFASMQRKNESLQHELELLHKLLVHIRTRSSVEVEDTIRRIRAGGDPLEIAKSLSIV